MKVGKIFSKAMVDADIVGAKNLSIAAGISYEKTLKIMNDQTSARFVDVRSIAECLGLKVEFVDSGDHTCTTINET